MASAYSYSNNYDVAGGYYHVCMFVMQRFIVCDMPEEMKLSSKFNEEIASYEEYFSRKYNLTTLRPDQPLLHVRPITENFDGIIPK